MDALKELGASLERASDCWDEIQSVFLSHLQSDFLEQHLAVELGAVADDLEYVVPGGTGPATIALIGNADFEYSLRILAPFTSRPHSVKWTGMHQIIGLRGEGAARIRRLTVPPQADINAFEPSLRLEEPPAPADLHRGVMASRSGHDILDVDAVFRTVVAQVLVYKRGHGELCWTFDSNLDSVYAEESSLETSRFRNVIDLARAAGRGVPYQIYERALGSSNPYVALLALKSMLECGNPEVFVSLERAMASPREDLRSGARRLFDSMFNA